MTVPFKPMLPKRRDVVGKEEKRGQAVGRGWNAIEGLNVDDTQNTSPSVSLLEIRSPEQLMVYYATPWDRGRERRGTLYQCS